MQKGRILLSILSFSLVSLLLFSLTVHALKGREKIIRETSSKILSAKVSELTITPSLMPSKIQVPSLTRTTLPSLTPTPTIFEPESKAISTESPTDSILNQVNEYRTSLGLSRVGSNSETCSFAQTRAKEIASLDTFNHGGFRNRINSKTLPYPGYHEVTENIAYNIDFTDVVNRWISSPGHAENMRKNTKFVCIGKYGDYYASEGWSP